jgi:hypothetical protein
VLPEGLGKLINSLTSSSLELATLRLVAKCLNHYASVCSPSMCCLHVIILSKTTSTCRSEGCCLRGYFRSSYKLGTGFILFAYNLNNLLQVFHSYHCPDHSQGTIHFHPSRDGLPTTLPASVADAGNLRFNWLLFDLLSRTLLEQSPLNNLVGNRTVALFKCED